jgi:hypothetical protein
VTTSQIPATRVIGGEGRGWKRQEGTEPYLFVALCGGSGGPRRLAGGGIEPTVGAGGGGVPVRKRARGSVVQLRCEAEKVMGGLVWAMWRRSGASMRGWWLAGVGLGAASSGASGGAFIGARGRIVAWARAAGEGVTKGQNRGSGCLAVTGEAHRGTSSARGRKMPPRGGFLRGTSGFCGLARDL